MRTVLQRLVIAIILVLLDRNCAYAGGKGDFLGLSLLEDWAKDRVETSSGSDAYKRSAKAHSDITIKINANQTHENYYFRFFEASGFYYYKGTPFYYFKDRNATHKAQHGNMFDVNFLAYQQQVDLMLGREFRVDQMYLKLFAGIDYQATNVYKIHSALMNNDSTTFNPGDYIITDGDPYNSQQGSRFHPKISGEAWLPIGENIWTSLNASITPHDNKLNTEYAVSARLGYQAREWAFEMMPLTIGPEAAAFGNPQQDTLRAGGFARVNILDRELTLSAGVNVPHRESASPYGTLGVYTKF